IGVEVDENVPAEDDVELAELVGRGIEQVVGGEVRDLSQVVVDAKTALARSAEEGERNGGRFADGPGSILAELRATNALRREIGAEHLELHVGAARRGGHE